MSKSPKRRVATLIILCGLATGSVSLASGWAPFANDDAATVSRGATVSVLDNGATSVLNNDWDIERDPLTAELTRGPKHGELDLNGDGTFLYKNDGDNKKDDEFRYRAFDGTGYSREVKVRIKIEKSKNNPPFVIGNPGTQEGVEGALFSLSLVEYFGDTDEGDVLRFTANGLPGGLRINRDSGLLSGTPNATDARDSSYLVTIIATDSGGLSASLNFSLRIYPRNRSDLKVSASVAVNPVMVGESAQWSIKVENLGPTNLDQGELVAQWVTSGASLSLNAPAGCSITGNNSQNPALRCILDGLVARTTTTYKVDGTQSDDGDNSLIAVTLSDDPVPGNNAAITGAQVVAAFSEGPTQVVTEAAAALGSVDFNGDGLNDVIATSTGGSTVYFNSGNRTLKTPGVSLGADSGGSDLVILDWNGDGNPDVAVARLAGAAARVYINDGSGAVSSTVDIKYSAIGKAVAAGAADLDGDGDDDLVLSGTGGSVVLGSSGGSAYTTTSLAAGPGIDVAIADLNNDGKQDIIIVESAGRSVRLLKNSGNGRDYSSQQLQRGSVAGVSTADINGDGNVDLLLALDGEDLTAPESKILIQRSDGTFPQGDKIGASPLSKLIAGDVDDDSIVDIVAINDAGVHQLYRGLPGGGFNLTAEQIVSDGMHRGIFVDFNDDQSLDLLLAGQDAGVIEIHANNGNGRLGLGDRRAPTITLKGPASITLAAGQEYIEEGASAVDDIDGDISAGIKINGAVNTTVVGNYTLTYVATDRAGNQGTTQRKIQVGVNQGAGGGGGGAISPYFLLLQLFLVIFLGRRYGRLGLALPQARATRSDRR
jgi:hypothetical protein